MRSFVAVALPDEVTSHLARRLDDVRAQFLRLRWIPRERWHLTTTFLGDIDADREDALAAKLTAAVAARQPFPLRLGGAGHFGRQVLWVGLGGDVDALHGLARTTTSAARRSRIDVERRPFRPHLTVARQRDDASLASAASALADYEGLAWTVREVALVASVLGPQPRYETRSNHVLKDA